MKDALDQLRALQAEMNREDDGLASYSADRLTPIIQALQEHIAALENQQEPVAKVRAIGGHYDVQWVAHNLVKAVKHGELLYTHPAPKAEVTDEQCEAIFTAVSMAMITRDVKTPERKCAIVRAALEARDGK